jgi:hypothetical protein
VFCDDLSGCFKVAFEETLLGVYLAQIQFHPADKVTDEGYARVMHYRIDVNSLDKNNDTSRLLVQDWPSDRRLAAFNLSGLTKEQIFEQVFDQLHRFLCLGPCKHVQAQQRAKDQEMVAMVQAAIDKMRGTTETPKPDADGVEALIEKLKHLAE